VVKYLVKRLLEEGADISGSASDDWTPLSIASSKGHLGTVKVLLSQGANPLVVDKYGWSPFDLAAVNGNVEMVEALLTHKSFDTVQDKKSRFGTIANALALYGYIGLLQYIVQYRRADLLSTDELNRAPVLCAASGGDVQTFEYLVGQGLPLDTIDAKGNGLIS
jgi:hypothetical protein